MIRIQITIPFRYQFEQLKKDIFFTAGDYYHLDAVKDKEEAKHILSPYYPFKNYIYVDVETIPSSLAEELGVESGFYNTFTLPSNDEVVPTALDLSGQFITAEDGSSSDDAPTKEPVPNRFDQTTDPDAVKTEVEVIPFETEEKEDLGIVESPKASPKVEMPNEDRVDEVENGGMGDRTARQEELEELHYKRVQEIAELYNIDYTNKKETIAAILKTEFSDPDEQPEDIKL